MQTTTTDGKTSPKNIEINQKKFQKMVFLTNAIDDGWTIKKSGDSYIFSKKHENKKEVFQKTYLEKFILSNQDINTMHSS
jgi:hypothetical protein